MDYTGVVAIPPLVTVVETPEFVSRAAKFMADEERDELIDHLARNPAAGVLVRGAGGIRKLRWGVGGRGKRGGARVIYFYHSNEIPLFLLTVFRKNERADLSQSERNDFRRLTKMLAEPYRRRKP